ncbi:hypothetical protein AB0M29_41450 [Streptomyces sp. NPDC051976]|uniref:hypothetical protein n=1 Tax=Streptomyces sp. NPDC051976 TaxID=3154947 RepID=UPI00341E9B53
MESRFPHKPTHRPASHAHAGSEKPPYTESSDASNDMPCGKGKARRVFTAQQQENGRGWDNPASMHDEIQLAATYFGFSQGKYGPDRDAKNGQGPTKVSYAMLSGTHHARAAWAVAEGGMPLPAGS